MPGYKDGEENILAIIQGLENFDSDNVSAGDWLILNNGKAAHYAIAKPGGSGEIVYLTPLSYQVPWTTIVEVWQSYNPNDGDEANLQALEDRTQEILDEMQKYRKLEDSGTTIYHAQVASIGIAEEAINVAGGLEYLTNEIVVAWFEEVEVTHAE